MICQAILAEHSKLTPLRYDFSFASEIITYFGEIRDLFDILKLKKITKSLLVLQSKIFGK